MRAQDDFFTCENVVANTSPERIDDAVVRVLTQIFRYGLDQETDACDCSPPGTSLSAPNLKLLSCMYSLALI